MGSQEACRESLTLLGATEARRGHHHLKSLKRQGKVSLWERWGEPIGWTVSKVGHTSHFMTKSIWSWSQKLLPWAASRLLQWALPDFLLYHTEWIQGQALRSCSKIHWEELAAWTLRIPGLTEVKGQFGEAWGSPTSSSLSTKCVGVQSTFYKLSSKRS